MASLRGMSCHPGRLGERVTTPVAASQTPAAPIPMPAMSLPEATCLIDSMIRFMTASGPSGAWVSLRSRCVMVPEESDRIEYILLPPKSTPTTILSGMASLGYSINGGRSNRRSGARSDVLRRCG